MKRRALSLLLAALLLSGLLPAAQTVSAEGERAVWISNETAEMEYTYAAPRSEGVANAIARAYQLTDVTWTPLKNVPGICVADGVLQYQEYLAGVEYRGVPYSYGVSASTYLGLNVSLGTFLTALRNEKSVLYTKNLYTETNPKAVTYYGTVCSKFVQYALNIPGAYSAQEMLGIPGLEAVAAPGTYSLEELELGDVLLDPAHHAALCTAIRYATDGSVDAVEVSESVVPLARRLWWTPESYFDHFKKFYICHYNRIDETPPPESVTLAAESALMPRYGDGVNYSVSENGGVVDVLRPGYARAIVTRDGARVQELALNGASSFRFDRSEPGELTMWLETEDGTRSEPVHVCVESASIQVTDSSAFWKGELRVKCASSSGTPYYVQLGVAHRLFFPLEGAEEVTLRFDPEAVIRQRVRVAYRNAYGVYLSSWTDFDAPEPAPEELFPLEIETGGRAARAVLRNEAWKSASLYLVLTAYDGDGRFVAMKAVKGTLAPGDEIELSVKWEDGRNLAELRAFALTAGSHSPVRSCVRVSVPGA